MSPIMKNSVEYVTNLPSPRLIKTHLQWEFLPSQIQNRERKPKIVYVARNAKDTCVSFYHHSRLISGYRGSFNELCKLFLEIHDLPSIIRKVAQFLNKDLTEEQITVLNDHLSFERMKSNPAVNYEEHVRTAQKVHKIQHSGHFMRSGQVGSWKNEMSEEMAEKFDQWTNKNLKGTGLEL